MKRLTLFLLLSAMALSAKSADFLDSFSNYRYQIRTGLNISTTNTTYVSDSTMNQLIREAIVEVDSRLMPIRDTSYVLTTNGMSAVSIDTNIVGIIDAYWKKSDSLKSLLYAPKEQWYQFEIKTLLDQVDYKARPSYYDYMDGIIFLYPVPVFDNDTIILTTWRKVRFISDTTTLSSIPIRYRQAVLDCARYKVAFIKQHPLTEVYNRNYIESMKLLNSIYNSRGGAVEKTAP